MIGQNYFILVSILLTIGPICIRGSFIFLSGRMVIDQRLRELFSYIPAAVFPALIVPATFFYQGKVDWLNGKERFLILIVSAVACYFVRNTLFVICFGLILLYLVTLA